MTLAAGVRRIQQEVEARHGMTVEAVTVGDCELDDDLGALLAAAREATVNAAKWSGADVISLFAEVEPAEVSVFVRDRGPRVRPRRGARGPQGAGRVDPRPDDAPRRLRDRPQRPGPGHRGDADHAPGGRRTSAEPVMSTPRA